MAIWNRVQALLFGGALATAASDGVRPILEPVRQHAWQRNQNRVLDPGTVARLKAQGLIPDGEAEEEAARQGLNPNRVKALIEMAQTAPGLAELGEMLNRESINKALFNHALAKHQIEPKYWDALFDLTNDKLSPSEIANAVQQGHMPNDGILPSVSAGVTPAEGAVEPLTPDGRPPSSVPLTQVPIDPLQELKASGLNEAQLKVLANLVGLPPGPESLLAMWNRGLIDEDSVDAGIREGHMKTKWAGAYKRFRWAVLSGQEYAEARLRDWITQDEMYAGGALTGHTKSQMDLFYKNRGRTATPRQLWLAVARKVVGPNYPGQEGRTSLASYEDHELAIRRSNIQPWYAKMLWDIRFNYPPLFQLNRLVTAGAIDSDTAALWASYNLEAPDVIEALKKYWDSLGGGTTDPNVKKAQTQLWTTTHRSYLSEEIDAATAQEAMTALAVTPSAQTEILALWDRERSLIRAQLTPAQVKKAYRGAILNRDTGQTWTRDDAVAALLERGYSANAANEFLDL